MIFDLEKHQERLAIIADDGTQLTYDELAERVRQRLETLNES